MSDARKSGEQAAPKGIERAEAIDESGSPMIDETGEADTGTTGTDAGRPKQPESPATPS